MPSSRDPLRLSPHWHVDCRLEAELPEDRVVGTRFLFRVLFGSLALLSALLCSWLLYINLSLRANIHDWDQRIADHRSDDREIQRLQVQYNQESAQIDGAYALVKSPFMISAFAAQLGRTRPDRMTIDALASVGADRIVMRGSLHESSERASRLLGNYVDLLARDPAIGPYFRDIVLTGLERRDNEDLLSFEITFRPKPAAP